MSLKRGFTEADQEALANSSHGKCLYRPDPPRGARVWQAQGLNPSYAGATEARALPSCSVAVRNARTGTLAVNTPPFVAHRAQKFPQKLN
jgi:hypothetical protein